MHSATDVAHSAHCSWTTLCFCDCGGVCDCDCDCCCCDEDDDDDDDDDAVQVCMLGKAAVVGTEMECMTEKGLVCMCRGRRVGGDG